MKKLKLVFLSLLFSLSAACYAFADVAEPSISSYLSDEPLSVAGAAAAAIIAGVLAFVYSKKKK